MKNHITHPQTKQAASAHQQTGRADPAAPPKPRTIKLKDIGKKGNLKDGIRREIYKDALNFYYARPKQTDHLAYKGYLAVLDLAEKGFLNLQKHNDERDIKLGKVKQGKPEKSFAAGDFDADLIAFNKFLDGLDPKDFEDEGQGG